MENVSDTTIKKCCRRAGILRQDFIVVQPVLSGDIEDDTDGGDLDDDEAGDRELTDLIHQIQGAHNACASSELITTESELPACLFRIC